MRPPLRVSALALLVVSCSGGGDSAPTTPPVTPPPTAVLTSVAVSAPAQSMAAGQTLQLSAAPKDQNGTAFTATVAWSSSSLSIATVNASGLVTGAGPGLVTITATATAGSASVTGNTQILVVAAPALTTVTISAPATSIVAGATTQLAATTKDQNGNLIAATVTWSSSVPTIASVNATSGLVTGVAAGTATITASAIAGGVTVTNTVQLTVTAAPPAAVLTSVTVTPSTASMFTGNALTLAAAPRDQNGTAMAATVTWSSSAPSVASVSASGGVSALSPGSATITASATAGGVTKTGTAVITVNAVQLVLTSVVISGGSSVSAGATLALSASPRDQNGNPIAATVTWTSSAPGFATVNAATGVVTGVAAGSTNITATATSGGTTRQGVLAVAVTGGFPLLAAVDATLGNSFSPGTVDIGIGGAVDFTFATTHNVSFSGGGAPASIPNTSSGTVRRTFGTAGTFDYSCTLHAGMIGTVIVH